MRQKIAEQFLADISESDEVTKKNRSSGFDTFGDRQKVQG
jgi:hypothetical protein